MPSVTSCAEGLWCVNWKTTLNYVVCMCKRRIECVSNIIRDEARVNQWKNLTSVIDGFKEIRSKSKYIFICFDMGNFYQCVSANLLSGAIDYGKQYISISQQVVNIMHARKSSLFIFNADKNSLLNRRCELFSNYVYQKKFLVEKYSFPNNCNL